MNKNGSIYKINVMAWLQFMDYSPVHSSIWHSNSFILARENCTEYQIQNYQCQFKTYATVPFPGGNAVG